MTPTRRFSGHSLARVIFHTIAVLAAICGLAFAYLTFIHTGRLPQPFKPRFLADGMVMAILVGLAALYLASRPAAVWAARPRRRRFSWRWAIPLVVLTLIAAGLRFYRVDAQGLDSAELIDVGRMSAGTLSAALLPGPRILDSWPTMHIPLYLFVQVAGDSEFSLRYLSILYSIMTVPAIFVLGRRMFSDRVGLLGAALVVGPAGVISFSQYGRMYGPLMFLAGLSGYFWYRLLEDFYWRRAPRKWMTLCYTATLILLAYLHHYGLILVGLQGLAGLAAMLWMRRLSPALLAAYVGVGLAYIPWLPMFYHDLHNKSFQAAYLPASLVAMTGEFATFFPSDATLGSALLLIAGLFIAVALWRAFRKPGRAVSPLLISPAVILGCWLLLPMLIAYFRSLTTTPIVQYRYFLVTLPALALLYGRGITRLPVPGPAQMAVGLAVPAVLVVNLFVGGYYVQPHNYQYREAIKYILDHDSQYPDSVIAGSMQGTPSQLDYYFARFHSARHLDLKLVPPAVDQSLKRIRAANTRYVWLIGEDYAFDPKLLDRLDQYYTRIDRKELYLETVWLYERKGAAPAQ